MKYKIFGSPGTGKTTKLISLIKNSEFPISKIGYCTFGRKALTDMKDRMRAEGVSDKDMEWFKTIHSMNFKLLGLNKDQVADNYLDQFCKQYGFKLKKGIKFNIDEPVVLQTLLNTVGDSLDDEFYMQMMTDRIELRPFNFIHPRISSYAGAYLHFKHCYFDWLRDNDYIDYTGMIERGIEQGILPPVHMLCIDEWQDLNPLQIKQIKKWADNITISYHAGDDDQTIFSFSGADPISFLDMECDDEQILGETFRLPSDILALSQEVITRNATRRDKKIITKKDDGGIYEKTIGNICASLEDKIIAGESTYILVRNNFIIPMLCKDLSEYGIPLSGYTTQTEAIKLLINITEKGYFDYRDLTTLTTGGIFPSSVYFQKGTKANVKNLLVNFPIGGISFEEIKKTGLKETFFTHAKDHNFLSLKIDVKEITYILTLLKKYGTKFNPVKIMTIHQSKGLEADNIVLIPDIALTCRESEEGRRGKKETESEWRVWYTAITRAKKRLFIATNTNYSNHKSRIQNVISVFINRQKQINNT